MIILSLFDYSGVWSEPYKQNGYEVHQIDIQLGKDIFKYKFPSKVHGILAAPPCTDFSVMGAVHWKNKKGTEQEKYSIALVRKTLEIINTTRPKWWVLENPVGRLVKMVPEIGNWVFWFHPYEYAGWADYPRNEAYTKKTCLWGNFRTPEYKPIEPFLGSLFYSGKRNGRSSLAVRDQNLRSRTPQGFAKAFYEVNK